MLRTLTAAAVAMALATAMATGPALATSHASSAEVIKIDKSAGKITLKHGPIKNLDMESMTMVFRVADPALLDKAKPGDKVRFEADRINGAITITTMDKAK
ncbi:MAG: copper-binding protein [Reyranella sp.]